MKFLENNFLILNSSAEKIVGGKNKSSDSTGKNGN